MRSSVCDRFIFVLLCAFAFSCLPARARAEEPSTAVQKILPIDSAELFLAPYVWKRTGNGAAARAEAAMPGAYLKTVVRGTKALGLVIDGTANQDCPPASMPVVEYSIDEGAFRAVPLARTGEVYTLSLADSLDPGKSHRVEIFLRAADLTVKRWAASTAHLRLAGLAIDASGTLAAAPLRPGRAIGFGDSITEGVGTDGLFTSWQLLGVNNARETWLPIVCAALDCEYGQLGSGGHGMSRTIHLPPLPETWDRFDPSTSRLSGGLLLPEPDFVFCELGTNDYDKDITADYTRWLTAMRGACPKARFFCIVPTLGVHRSEVAAAVAGRNRAGDERVYLIDPAPLQNAFRANQGATYLAYDGVHPSLFGHALLGAFVAVEVQKILGRAR